MGRKKKLSKFARFWAILATIGTTLDNYTTKFENGLKKAYLTVCEYITRDSKAERAAKISSMIFMFFDNYKVSNPQAESYRAKHTYDMKVDELPELTTKLNEIVKRLYNVEVTMVTYELARITITADYYD